MNNSAPGIIAILVLVGVVALLWLMAGTARSHEWYTGVRNIHGQQCCDVRDCVEVPSRTAPDGSTEVFIDGKWWDAFDPEWYVPDVVSQDGAWHGCIMPHETEPRCTMGPLTGT